MYDMLKTVSGSRFESQGHTALRRQAIFPARLGSLSLQTHRYNFEFSHLVRPSRAVIMSPFSGPTTKLWHGRTASRIGSGE